MNRLMTLVAEISTRCNHIGDTMPLSIGNNEVVSQRLRLDLPIRVTGRLYTVVVIIQAKRTQIWSDVLDLTRSAKKHVGVE